VRSFVVLALVLSWAPRGTSAADEKPPSPKDVAQAIQRGAAWLQKEHAKGFTDGHYHDMAEIVALTLGHAGVSPKEGAYALALETMRKGELAFTYRVATQAMALSRLNPYLYRARLAHCAQWLVDSQLPGGEWGYPGGIRGRENATRALKADPPVTDEEAAGGEKAPPIVIRRRSDPAAFEGLHGDFSNTQFALLGLRACLDAKIEVPKETWQAALDYQLRVQQEDGSFGYWNNGEQDEAGYASLTAAGAVGIAICVHNLGRNGRADPNAQRAVRWLDQHWMPQENAHIDRSTFVPPSTWQYYHLYAIERVGRVLGFKKLAKRPWYAAGANWLLTQQKADGSWEEAGVEERGSRQTYFRTADTCFAILFLAQATPPLTGS